MEPPRSAAARLLTGSTHSLWLSKSSSTVRAKSIGLRHSHCLDGLSVVVVRRAIACPLRRSPLMTVPWRVRTISCSTGALPRTAIGEACTSASAQPFSVR